MHALLDDLRQLEIAAYWLWYAIECELTRPLNARKTRRFTLAA